MQSNRRFQSMIGKKGIELSLSTIIVLVICGVLLLFIILFSGSLRGYILSLFDSFSIRGR